MTTLPPPTARKLGLVIDLDICVGCHACAVACKEWNDGGSFGPLPDSDPYGAEPDGVWFNRIHSYEVQGFGIGDSGIAGSRESGNGIGNRKSGSSAQITLRFFHSPFTAPDSRCNANRSLPPLLPALRDAGLRHRVPDRGKLQAGRGRHRAGR
jgi:hypothetical protein